MDNAIAELHQESTGGVLVWLFDLLWRQKSEKQLAASRYHAHMPRIANSIIIHHARVRHWFFVPRSVRPGDAVVIKKKRKQNTTARLIAETLITSSLQRTGNAVEAEAAAPTTMTTPRRHGPIVAQLVMRRPSNAAAAGGGAGVGGRGGGALPAAAAPGALPARGEARLRSSGSSSSRGAAADATHEIPLVRYLDAAELHKLMLRDTMGVDTALLLEFVPPKAGDPLLLRNTVLQCQWQPSFCFVERCVNNYLLSDSHRSGQERGEATEASGRSTSTTVPPGVLLDRVRNASNAIAEHIAVVAECHVRSMTLNFKVDQSDGLVLLWCQRVRLGHTTGEGTRGGAMMAAADRDDTIEDPASGAPAETAALRPSRAVRSSVRPSSSSAPMASAATPLDASGRVDDPRRGGGVTHREPRALLAAERAADRALARLTPCSHFAARRRVATALARARLDGNARSDPKRLQEQHRRAASPAAAGGPVGSSSTSEIVCDMSWGVQSRLDTALLRRPDAGPFALPRAASHVARMGLRERYLETLRSAVGVAGASTAAPPQSRKM